MAILDQIVRKKLTKSISPMNHSFSLLVRNYFKQSPGFPPDYPEKYGYKITNDRICLDCNLFSYFGYLALFALSGTFLGYFGLRFVTIKRAGKPQISKKSMRKWKEHFESA